jgi:hypothetical protein
MKNNLPMLVGIGLPVAFVVALFAFVALPGMFGAKPGVDFVFAIKGEGYYNGLVSCEYSVRDEKITVTPVRQDYAQLAEKLPTNVEVKCDENNSPEIYHYSVNSKALREISFEEAQEFNLDKGPTSSDGFTARLRSQQYDIFDVLGAGENRPTVEIVKDGRARETVELPAQDFYYYDDRFDFVGWIVR